MLTGGLVIIYQCFNALTKDIEYLNGNMRRPRNSISNRGRRVEGVGIVLPKIACGTVSSEFSEILAIGGGTFRDSVKYPDTISFKLSRLYDGRLSQPPEP